MTLESGSSYESANVDGYAVTSNTESSEEIAKNLTEPKEGAEEDPEQEASEAAKKLGARGGKAAAEKRAKAASTKGPENDAESTEEAESEEDSQVDERKLGKPRHDPIARMKQATKQAADLKAELQRERDERARERAELDDLRRRAAPQPARQEAPQPRKAQQETAGDPKPKVDDFEAYEDFTEELAAWRARQEFAALGRQASEHQKRQQFAESIHSTLKAAADRLKAFEQTTPDFESRLSDDVLALRPTIDLRQGEQASAPNFLADEIINSEMGPALMLHLSDHPDVHERIASMSSRREVAREVAKLEARLEVQKPSTPARTVSNARPPVKPVTGAPSAGDDDMPSDDEPYEVWKKKTEALEAKQRRAHR